VKEIELAAGQFQRCPVQYGRALPEIKGEPVVPEQGTVLSAPGYGAGGGGVCWAQFRIVRLGSGPTHHGRDPRPHLPGPEGFGDVVIRPGLECVEQVRLLRPAREHHNIGISYPPDTAQDFKPVNIRQADIQGHNIGPLGPHQINTLAPVRRCMDFKSSLAEHPFEKIPDVLVIFDNYGHA
jgi:hypothetical protein